MEPHSSAQCRFFCVDSRYAALSAAGESLEILNRLIEFERFQPGLDAALKGPNGSKGGRPPKDAAMMLKVFVRQTLCGLSDAQAEFEIIDRRSFGRFSEPGRRRQHTR